MSQSQVGLSETVVNQIPGSMVHWHIKHEDGFMVFMACGVKRLCMDVIFGGQEFAMYIVLIYHLIFRLQA